MKYSHNPRVLALITARGGSKGIPGKNIIPIAGRPLLSYAITAALDSRRVDSVVVSTDSLEIARIAVEWGAQVPFLRPKEISGDSASSEDAILHALDWLEANSGQQFDILILLQPTSPIRTSDDITNALNTFLADPEATSLISVSPSRHHPKLMKVIDESGILRGYEGDIERNFRRQELRDVYCQNGAIYIAEVDHFRNSHSFTTGRVIPYIMSVVSSFEIDEPDDIPIVEALLLHKNITESPSKNA
ncbi:CMP-N,N'-diacetyllegionaminic acid synthase [Candidatus Brocadiaceae bacterium]|nr:CMP-N,N'-diacetyllegionaminic acid synthase [Candidatus Brocadiaceae bacterium]